MQKSLLQRSAVASGLITQEELDQTLADLRAEFKSNAISDEQLGTKLVAGGKLNAWQVEQLRNGRTKFNLGPYHVIDSIGQGGMGQVFKAEHTIMGRIVAVKVLPRSKSTPTVCSAGAKGRSGRPKSSGLFGSMRSGTASCAGPR